MMERQIRIGIVDDHPGVRVAVRNFLANAQDIIVVGEGVDGTEAIQLANSQKPDILLLDEVLAVGDGAFQKKCLDEINRFKAKGVTILFVSHAMDQVRRTCEKALWLDRGAAKAWGDSDSVLKQYEQYMASLTKKN